MNQLVIVEKLSVAQELRSMKLPEEEMTIKNNIEEILIYYDFPSDHWSRIHTNKVMEKLNRKYVAAYKWLVDS